MTRDTEPQFTPTSGSSEAGSCMLSLFVHTLWENPQGMRSVLEDCIRNPSELTQPEAAPDSYADAARYALEAVVSNGYDLHAEPDELTRRAMSRRIREAKYRDGVELNPGPSMHARRWLSLLALTEEALDYQAGQSARKVIPFPQTGVDATVRVEQKRTAAAR